MAQCPLPQIRPWSANLYAFEISKTFITIITAATFFRKSLLPAGAMMRKWGTQTRHTLRRNTASIIKDLI